MSSKEFKVREITELNEANRNRPLGKRAPRVLVLVGIPGSGKSTFASFFTEFGLEIICQDEMGSRVRCERRMSAALLAGRDVVVDRCNFDQSQRKHWLDYGNAVGAEVGVVVFALPIEECKRRVQNRTGHATLQPGAKSEKVVNGMVKQFVFPRPVEGFAFCRVIRGDSDALRVCNEIRDWFGRS